MRTFIKVTGSRNNFSPKVTLVNVDQIVSIEKSKPGYYDFYLSNGNKLEVDAAGAQKAFQAIGQSL